MWITDPVTGQKSVSLTLLIGSFLAVLTAGVLQMIGKASTTSLFSEVFYSCTALYFGRRLSIGGKGFTADKAEDLKEKVSEK